MNFKFMLNDQFNNNVNTNDIDIIESLNNFESNFLAYSKNSNKIFELSEKYKSFLTFQLHSVLISIFLDNQDSLKNANKYLSESKILIKKDNITEREFLYYNFLSNLLCKKFFKALTCLESLIYQNNNDLFFAKIAQIFYFSVGNYKKMLELAYLVIENNRKNPYALSMLSFALEESNEIDKAMEVASKAIDIDETDPWSHHTLAHVFEVKNDPERGISTLEGLSYHWNKCNSFIYTHNWWHVALFNLKINNFKKVFEIFNKHLWDSPNADNSYSQDQAGAVSLLIRLKLKNKRIKKEWEKISEKIIIRKNFFSDPFITPHYAYVIGSYGEKDLKTKFLEELEFLDQSKNDYDKKIWQKSGVPLSKAMISHAEKNYRDAVYYFKQSKEYWHLIGGSHTQRDLFDLIYNDAKKKLK